MQESQEEPYVLGRGFSANVRYAIRVSMIFPGFKADMKRRLNLQYFLWRDGGFFLHPRIPIHGSNLRVAEIGIGTGCAITRHLCHATNTNHSLSGYGWLI